MCRQLDNGKKYCPTERMTTVQRVLHIVISKSGNPNLIVTTAQFILYIYLYSNRLFPCSIDGARQLHLDVCYLRDWLTPDNCSDIPDTACINLQNLHCFTDFLQGISLLLQQPRGHKQGRFDSTYPESHSSQTYRSQSSCESRSTDRETISTSRMESEVSQVSPTFSSDGETLTDSERWIRLRLHGSGRRRWKAKLNCFQTDSNI
jgi:hypothetical protein